MLSIKVITKTHGGDVHHVLSLCKNDLDGSGWYEIKELTGDDIRFIISQGGNPYIETTNVKQDILKQLINE